MKKRVIGSLAIIFTCLMWGGSFYSSRIVGDVIPPITLAFIRFAIASVVLFFVYIIKEPKVKIKKEHRSSIIIGGLLGITFFFTLQNVAIPMLAENTGPLISGTTPFLTLIAEVIFFDAVLTAKQGIGSIISLIGAYFVVGGILSARGGIIGYLLMIIATIFWVIYSVFQKPLLQHYSALVIVFYQAVVGTITLFPFIFMETTHWRSITPKIGFNLLYLAIGCSALAYYLYSFSLKRLGPSTTTLYMNSVPVFTMIISLFIGNKSISKYQVLGTILVMGAAILTQLERKRTKE